MYYLIKLNTDSEIKLARLNSILLRKNNNLNKINGELDSFVYKASHDMRAPLTSLLGLLSLSKKENDINILKKFMALQEKTILKLDSYIVDILNMSKNTRTAVEYKEVNFKEAIEQIFSQLNFLEINNTIEKQINIENNKKYIGDEVRINIILNNLISNSLRYFDQSKSKSLIKVDVEVDEHMVTLVVYDNGIGIQKIHMEHVCNMFYRATEKTNGSGLGLYIVKETISKLNGTIKINSEIGKYTEAIIELPNAPLQN